MADNPAIQPATDFETPHCASEVYVSKYVNDHPSVAFSPAHNQTLSVPVPSGSPKPPAQVMCAHGHTCCQVAMMGSESNSEVTCQEIECEVQLCRKALGVACPQDHRRLAFRWAALARALEGRYIHTWDIEDVEERLNSWRNALGALTSPTSTEHSSREITGRGIYLKHSSRSLSC